MKITFEPLDLKIALVVAWILFALYLDSKGVGFIIQWLWVVVGLSIAQAVEK